MLAGLVIFSILGEGVATMATQTCRFRWTHLFFRQPCSRVERGGGRGGEERHGPRIHIIPDGHRQVRVDASVVLRPLLSDAHHPGPGYVPNYFGFGTPAEVHCQSLNFAIQVR